MTTIAWDGKTLAADKQLTKGGAKFSVTKIKRIKGLLIGIAGDAFLKQQLLHWFREGTKHEDFPELQKSEDTNCHVITINADKECHFWGTTPHPILIEEDFFAIGSGAHFALATMECGRNSVEAVRVAAKFDCNSGLGVDILEMADDDIR